MGHRSHTRAQTVWTNGQNDDHAFQYDADWMCSAAGRPLSLSLLFTSERTILGESVSTFDDNLLPDS